MSGALSHKRDDEIALRVPRKLGHNLFGAPARKPRPALFLHMPPPGEAASDAD